MNFSLKANRKLGASKSRRGLSLGRTKLEKGSNLGGSGEFDID